MAEQAKFSKEIICDRIENLPETAGEILNFCGKEKILLFKGQMGVGKTTLIKEICRNLEVEDQVSSPTYSIVNEYVSKKGEQIFHFDFYRIKKAEEAMDIGYEDYFYSGNYCLVEWPERVEDLIPEKYVKVELEIIHNDIRLIHLSKYE